VREVVTLVTLLLLPVCRARRLDQQKRVPISLPKKNTLKTLPFSSSQTPNNTPNCIQALLPAAASLTTDASTSGRAFPAAFSTSSNSSSNKPLRWLAASAGALAGATAASALLTASADHEGEHGLEAPHYPWSHSGPFDAFDASAVRRGFQVYTQVCAACHSLQYIHYRDLVGVAYTEEEAKAIAADVEMTDGPNDEGESFERPGRLADVLPSPYANEQAARYANGGAYPPDLSLITNARHNGQNYVFALLQGYREPPAGISS
jgi:mono/diheme cytochrome c family protein